jgi:hypothetical protein
MVPPGRHAEPFGAGSPAGETENARFIWQTKNGGQEETVSANPVESPQRGFLETARTLSVSGPGDWAEKIEQYLHGPLADDE